MRLYATFVCLLLHGKGLHGVGETGPTGSHGDWYESYRGPMMLGAKMSGKLQGLREP